ncbi:MAG: TetR/AcrR family transcriptional regulator [Chloroflexi bacterium]|nr:TetR/AcrR family transcriptional regulator [Chloroflexota bacterium]NOG66525.1 TetR/AcrR family transcriptional regulator [Chloroflexota bacterium]
MPHPARIDRIAILQTARAMMELEGIDGLSVNRLAAALGVKPPSLYHHFTSKAALLRELNAETSAGLVKAMQTALHTTDAPLPHKILAMAQAYRAYAHEHPVSYGLAYTNVVAELRPDPEFLEKLALTLQVHIAELVGPGESLPALRGLWALVHGFVVLELGGQFQRGGNLDATFEQVVMAQIEGWTQR